MAENPKDITELNDLRAFVRELYLDSFHKRGGHDVIKAEGTANDLKTRMNFFFDEEFIKKNLEKEDVLKFDSRYVDENPLFAICKMRHFYPDELTMEFALLDLLSENQKGLSLYDLRLNDEDNNGKGNLFKNYFPKRKDKEGDELTGKDHKQIEPILKNLELQGIISCEKQGKRNVYTLCDTKNLQNILHSKDVLNVIRFASEVFPCGVIGSYILDNIDCSNHKSPVHFKHHFIYNALDSEIIYNLLNAINTQKFATLGFENSIIKIVPIQIRQSIRDGRTYLVYYNINNDYNGFSLANIENIKYVKPEDVCSSYSDLLAQFSEYKKYLGGKAGKKKNSEKEKLEFTICFDDDELYIPERLKRESFLGKVVVDGNTARFTTELYDTSELKPWIRTFFGRITNFNFSNQEYQKQIEHEIEVLYDLYNSNKSPTEETNEQADPKIEVVEKKENHERKSNSKSPLRMTPYENVFFNRIYSLYYNAALKTVKAIQNKEITTLDDLNDYLKNFYFLNGKTSVKTEKKLDAFYDVTCGIIKIKNNVITTPIKNDIEFPLTKLEISFLKAMILDSRCRLLLDDETIKSLEKELNSEKYKNITPYFNEENYVFYDQYLNGDKEKYKDENYIKNFKLILKALDNQEPLKFEYIEDNIEKMKISVPQKIEYSQKEDRFKVIINSKARPLDIKNIKNCSYTKAPVSDEKQKETLTCTVEINDNTPTHYHRTRFFREFSHFERNCKKIDENGHKLSFEFEKGDYREIAIRLLQFGPNVFVGEPKEVVDLIREKVTRQYGLVRNRE